MQQTQQTHCWSVFLPAMFWPVITSCSLGDTGVSYAAAAGHLEADTSQAEGGAARSGDACFVLWPWPNVEHTYACAAMVYVWTCCLLLKMLRQH